VIDSPRLGILTAKLMGAVLRGRAVW